jgi:cytochrome c-type biogenesis protein
VQLLLCISEAVPGLARRWLGRLAADPGGRRIVSISSLVTSGPLILAIPVAAAAGAVTFLSPCVLPLVPGYLSYLTGMSGAEAEADHRTTPDDDAAGTAASTVATAATQRSATQAQGGTGTLQATAVQAGRVSGGPDGGGPDSAVTGGRRPGPPRGMSSRRTVAGTALFVLGFSALFAVYGTAFGALGSVLGQHQVVITKVLGGVTVVLGLMFAGVFDRFTFTGRIVKPSIRPRAGLIGAPLLGVMFGLGWSPCIGPTLTAVLNLGFGTGSAARGAFLAFVYSLGLGIPFLFVALAMQRGMRVFGFARRHAPLIARIGGGMLVLLGILEVTGTWATVIIWLKVHWWAGAGSPL